MEAIKCVLCGRSAGRIDGHHLSYEPEEVVLLCHRHHMMVHSWGECNVHQRNMVNEWVEKYGCHWVKGTEKYWKSSWVKKRRKERYDANRELRIQQSKEWHIKNKEKDIKNRRNWYLKNREEVLKKTSEWARAHPEKRKEIMDRRYKKVMSDPILHQQQIERKREETKRRKQNATAR
jgi:hypothetical protein